METLKGTEGSVQEFLATRQCPAVGAHATCGLMFMNKGMNLLIGKYYVTEGSIIRFPNNSKAGVFLFFIIHPPLLTLLMAQSCIKLCTPILQNKFTESL